MRHALLVVGLIGTLSGAVSGQQLVSMVGEAPQEPQESAWPAWGTTEPWPLLELALPDPRPVPMWPELVDDGIIVPGLDVLCLDLVGTTGLGLCNTTTDIIPSLLHLDDPDRPRIDGKLVIMPWEPEP